MGLIKTAQPALHGDQHLPDGSDPIPGLLLAGGDTYEAQLLALSPAGYWKLNETTGDWADSSGQGRTLTHTTRTGEVRGDPGVVDEDDGTLAVTVDGGAGGSTKAATYVGSRIADTGFDFSNIDPFTVIAWANPDSLPASPTWSDGICGSVDLESAESGQGYGLYIDGATGAPLFRRRDDVGTEASAFGLSPLTTGAWVMLAGVYTGSQVELYVNGELVDTAASTGNFTVNKTHSFYVGSCGISEGVGGTWAPFRGTIDSVSLFAADIGDQLAGLYEAATGTPVSSGVDSIAASGDPPLTGDVTLSEGANITLTQVGQDIAIAAASGGAPTGTAGGALDGTYPNPGLAATVAGAGLAETSNVLSVNVDASTIEIASDTLRVKADGITANEIAANAVGSSELAATTVSAGSYGDATHIATFTVDADGRLTAAGTATITSGTSATDTAGWMPLTTVVGGVPDLVWDATDSLIPTYGPF